MEKIGFVIVDEQIEGRLFADGAIFRNKKEVVNQLVDFHSVDWGEKMVKEMSVLWKNLF